MYIIKWRYLKTNVTGQGSPLPYEIAKAWVELLNSQYPDMDHWIEALA